MSADEDIETMGDDTMDITGYDEEEEGGLFWSMKLEPNKPIDIDPPSIDGYIVHVTNACFGANVTQKSRSVIMIKPPDNTEETPICVLRQSHHENHSLDLLFNESATITVKGSKPSVVYLTGYIQPPVDMEPEIDPMDAMYEDMNDEEIEAALKEQKRQQMALDDDEEEEEEEEPQLIGVEEEEEEEEGEQEEEEESDEPPAKKQKTTTGSKSTKNGTKSEGTKKRKSPQQKAKKSPQQKPIEAPLDDDNKEKEKEEEKNDNKKDKKDNKKDKNKDKKDNKKDKKQKKMLNMKGGIKYRDMKVGNGSSISVGDKLSVFYVGQTDNKKVFDKCISGTGFEFNFGAGDVIKGWDLGIKGMRVGGKRKLIIPPKLGYGANGSPPTIPSNATLTFTIEIKAAN